MFACKYFFVWFISRKCLNNGIAKANNVMVPLLFIMMGAIVIYFLTLNSVVMF
jgi:SNF family Na+-dependent transporter